MTGITGAFSSSSLDETGGVKNEPYENSTDITIEIEEKLLCDTQKWCSEHGVTVEQLIIDFIRFCACPENHETVREWFAAERV